MYKIRVKFVVEVTMTKCYCEYVIEKGGDKAAAHERGLNRYFPTAPFTGWLIQPFTKNLNLTCMPPVLVFFSVSDTDCKNTPRIFRVFSEFPCKAECVLTVLNLSDGFVSRMVYL